MIHIKLTALECPIHKLMKNLFVSLFPYPYPHYQPEDIKITKNVETIAEHRDHRLEKSPTVSYDLLNALRLGLHGKDV